jgi:hypothetical protein
MDIQNSLNFAILNKIVKPADDNNKTWWAGSVSVHGIIISYDVWYKKKHLLTGYLGNNKLIVPLDTLPLASSRALKRKGEYFKMWSFLYFIQC